MGARNVEAALAGWDRDIEASVDADLFSRFPFDRRSGDDLDPQTLTEWLQPKRGRLAAELEPAVAGLVVQTQGWDGRARHRPAQPCTGDEVCVRVPGALLATLDRLAAASDLLWDDAGKPRPLEVEVTPRPFTLTGGDGPVPELIRLTVGETSLFYFNQRPKRSVLAIDWTRDQTATLSVQLKQDGSLSLTPPAVAASGTPWSFYHLLQQGERRATTYTWRIRLGSSQVLTVSYDVVDRAAQQLGGARAVVSRGPR
jgi:type VI secretion system protein ImpL